MSGFESEADARIVIDGLLRDAGWDPTDKSQVRADVSLAPPPGSAMSHGASRVRADYVLYDQSGRPLAVVEAKRNAIHPYIAKQQALPYAQNIGAPFVFLTNGDLTYFWDYQNDDARPVAGFFSRRDLERLVSMRKNRQPLAMVAIPEHYLRTGEPRDVRPYQQNAMRALDQALELGNVAS